MSSGKVLRVTDIVIRATAMVGLLPFALMALFLSAMATDAPGSSIKLAYLLLLAGGFVGSLILVSAINPDVLSRPFLRLGSAGKAVGRVPSYIYAVVTVLYFFTVIIR